MPASAHIGSDLPTLDTPAELGRIESVESLRHNAGNAATGGIWRIVGSDSSAVLKIARPPSDEQVGSPFWQTSDEPAHWNYWCREVLAYTTGLAATAYQDGGITAPELIRTAERADGSIELWIATVDGEPGTSWPAAQLGDFARQLGLAQAAWVDRVPDLPWLSRRWLAQYLAGWNDRFGPDDRYWEHELASAWPVAVRDSLRRLVAERDAVLAVAETSPRTLCHLDVWPANLIAAGTRTVLLDWSFVGEGGVGEDVANLIFDSVADGLIDMELLPAITERATEGYIEGLRDGGWSGSADEVRSAIMAYGAAKYSWFGPARLEQVVQGGAFASPAYGQDRSGEEALHRLERLVTLLAAWADATLSAK